MLNRVELIGNIGKDPKIRPLNSGGNVAEFPIATTQKWRDQETGQKMERTEWHRIVVFRSWADFVERFFAKGLRIYVSGELRTRKWKDNSGDERYTTEVVVQGPRAQLLILSPFQDRKQGPTTDPTPF